MHRGVEAGRNGRRRAACSEGGGDPFASRRAPKVAHRILFSDGNTFRLCSFVGIFQFLIYLY